MAKKKHKKDDAAKNADSEKSPKEAKSDHKTGAKASKKTSKVALKDLRKKTNDSKKDRDEILETTKKNISEKNKEEGQLAWLKMITIFAGIVFFIFLVVFFVMHFDDKKTDLYEDSNSSLSDEITSKSSQELLSLTAGDLTLITLYNENCAYCREEMIAEDLKLLVNDTNLTSINVEISSEVGKKLKQELIDSGYDFRFSPLFLFTKSVVNTEFYSIAQQNNLFIETNEYVLFNPQVIQVKYLDEEFPIYDNSITFGNPDGVKIVLISDYFCENCRVLDGDLEFIQKAILENNIPQEYNAPIPVLLKNALDNEDELMSFQFTFVPAPTLEQSTASHIAAYCGYMQDSFELMHTAIIQANNIDYGVNEYSAIAEQLGMNKEEFEYCYNSESAQEFINSTQRYLIEQGIVSLPAMVVGHYPVSDVIDFETVSLLVNAEVIAEMNLTTNTTIVN